MCGSSHQQQVAVGSKEVEWCCSPSFVNNKLEPTRAHKAFHMLIQKIQADMIVKRISLCLDGPREDRDIEEHDRSFSILMGKTPRTREPSPNSQRLLDYRAYRYLSVDFSFLWHIGDDFILGQSFNMRVD